MKKALNWIFLHAAVTGLIILLLTCIKNYAKDNPKEEVDKGYWIPEDDINS